MLTRLAASALSVIAVTFSAPASAASLPGIKTTPANAVPACATPGRLMSFLKSRNSRVDPRYDQLAVYYMRHGEELGLRWDIAFFQMLLETANLAYTGDVDASQNNFAGLGATGGGVRGESFPDIDRGVRAHLEHVLMYSGETVKNPVADRTRKIQEWGVLTPWQRGIKGPITFSHLGKKWAPGSGGYSRDIGSIAQQFFDGACKKPDPQPELVALARGDRKAVAATKTTTTPPVKAATASSADLVAAVISRRAQAAEPAGLGGPNTSAKPTAPDTAAAAGGGEQPAKAVTTTVINATNGPGITTAEPAAEKTAMVANEARKAVAEPQKEATKCRVWTASYGGAKAIIIKAISNDVINYTVLDVNAGKEKREAEAYIAAYAKGGETLEEFASASAALDKAFELCPEG